MSHLELNPSIYNKEKKPIEELKIAVDHGKDCVIIPALSHQFSNCRFMVPYHAPPKPDTNGQFLFGAKEEWLNQTKLCIEDTRWLLGLKHHRFWSQVVFQKSSLDGLVSFLQEAYPYYSLDALPNDGEIKEQYNELAHLIFSLILRLTTKSESEYEWIGVEKFAEIIYNNFIMSVPIMLDICSIYGRSNSTRVGKIIEDIFEIQPAYKEDLRKCMGEVKSVFITLEGRLTGGTSSGEVIKLSDLNVHKNGLTLLALEDILLYMLDIVVTLATFVEFFPLAATFMHENKLETLIASMYETVMTVLQSHIKRFCSEEIEVETYFRCIKRLNLVRFYLIELFRATISVPLNTLIKNRDKMRDEDVKTVSDSFITILADSVTEKCFIADYIRKYSLDQDINFLLEVCPDIDSVKYEYIAESIYSHEREREMKDKVCRSTKVTQVSSRTIPKKYIEAVVKNEVTGVELESLISEVKDILPHLGEGFVQQCLQHFNYSSSSVINAVLEDSLPDDLKTLDQQLPIIPEEELGAPSSSGLPERVNIFDNDEFDIMSRDYIDKSKVHKGKRKSKHKDLKDLLDDKSHVEELREIFSKFSNVECEDADYDDEYDDTYDSVDVSVGEAGELERRKIVMNQKFPSNCYGKGDEDDEEESNSEPESDQKNSNFEAFVENPEVVRQRYEERRLTKQGYPRDKNVLGKPRGQGQEKDVLLNRHKKSVHKSSQGNHNRRKGAQYKRSQGMFPA